MTAALPHTLVSEVATLDGRNTDPTLAATPMTARDQASDPLAIPTRAPLTQADRTDRSTGTGPFFRVNAMTHAIKDPDLLQVTLTATKAGQSQPLTGSPEVRLP